MNLPAKLSKKKLQLWLEELKEDIILSIYERSPIIFMLFVRY